MQRPERTPALPSANGNGRHHPGERPTPPSATGTAASRPAALGGRGSSRPAAAPAAKRPGPPDQKRPGASRHQAAPPVAIARPAGKPGTGPLAPVAARSPRPEAATSLPTSHATNSVLLALGLFQLLTGIAILLVPHRLAEHLFEHWVSNPLVTGAAMVAAGGALLWVRWLPVRNPTFVFGSLGLTALILLAQVFLTLGEIHAPHWHWTVVFGVMALTTVGLAALLARYPTRLPKTGFLGRLDLAALMAQAIALATGLLMLAMPVDAYGGAAYDGFRPGYMLYTLGFVLLGGALMLATFAAPARWQLAIRVGNGLLALLFVAAALGFVRAGVLFGAITYLMLALSAGAAALRDVRGLPSLAMTSARRRVSLAVTTAFVVVALVLTVLLISAEEQELEATLLASALSAAQAKEERIELFLASQVTAVGIFEDALEAGGLRFDANAAQAAVGNVVDEFPGLVNVSVVNPQGRELLRSDGLPLSDLSQDRAVASASTLGVTFGEPALDAASGEYVIRLAQGIDDDDGRSLGRTVVAMVSLPYLNSLLTVREFGEGEEAVEAAEAVESAVASEAEWEIVVIDRARRLIALTEAADMAEMAEEEAKFSANHPAVDAVLTGKSGTTVVSHPGAGAELYGFAPVQEFVDWGVLAEQPVTVAFAGIQRAREGAFVLLLVAAAAIAGLALIFARVLLQPVADLVAPVMAFGRGDYRATLPPADDSEIGTLTTAFGRMRDEAREREQRLTGGVRLEERGAAPRRRSQGAAQRVRDPPEGWRVGACRDGAERRRAMRERVSRRAAEFAGPDRARSGSGLPGGWHRARGRTRQACQRVS